MENKKEEAFLPYGNLVTKILEETGYNFGDEEFKGETTIIGNFVLPSMKFEIINGRITEKPSSKSTKRIIQLWQLHVSTTHNQGHTQTHKWEVRCSQWKYRLHGQTLHSRPNLTTTWPIFLWWFWWRIISQMCLNFLLFPTFAFSIKQFKFLYFSNSANFPYVIWILRNKISSVFYSLNDLNFPCLHT